MLARKSWVLAFHGTVMMQ